MIPTKRPAKANFRAHAFPRASTALTIALAASFAPIALAQSNTESVLSSLIITSTRTPIRVDEALAEVTVISRPQIERSTGRSLSELLSQQAGITSWSNGGAGKSSSVSLRGLESRHTLLIIDGVQYGSATVGTSAWENIPTDMIERIEIVRGPLSGLYGSSAVGGVVHVFTRSGKEGFQSNGNITLGSNSTRNIGGGMQFGNGKFDAAVQLQRNATNGFSATSSSVPFGNHNPDNDGFEQSSASLSMGWRLSPQWRLYSRALVSEGETQFDDGASANSRADLRSRVYSAGLSGSMSQNWRTNLRVSKASDEYETLESASAFATIGTISTEQKQLTWENTFVTGMGELLLLAEKLDVDVSKAGAQYTVTEREVRGLAIGLNGASGRHAWQGNVRRDRNSQFGSQTTGTLAYGYDLNKSWTANASYGTSFVAPTFNQLYFPGFGNDALQPEEGKHSELSLRWANDKQSFRMAYFDNRIRGYISLAPVNVPRTRIDGYSFSYEGKINNWTLTGSAERIDPRNDTDGSANNGKVLARRSKNNFRFGADVDKGDWRYGITWVVAGGRYDDAANTRRLGGFSTFDLRSTKRLNKNWRLGFQLNNASNKAYQTVFGYNQPGRETYVTLRYNSK